MDDANLISDAADADLDELASLVERRSGIVFLGDNRQEFANRARVHMAGRRFASASDLVRALRASPAEYDELLERLLSKPARFFQPAEVFDVFQRRVLPEMHMKKFWDKPRSLRVWSVGCGTGEEAYSIALAISEALDTSDAWHLHLLATDVSRLALQHADRGVYTRDELASVSPQHLEANFARAGDLYMARPALRNRVTFSRANLAEPFYLGRFDCIFCIGVLPYHAAGRRAELVQRFFEYLEPGGYLFLAPGEILPPSNANFEAVEHGRGVTYQKPAAGSPRRSAHRENA